MPKISVFDFKGGKNSREDQRMVADFDCVASSRNVWSSGGALTKVPGYDSMGTLSVASVTAGNVTLATAAESVDRIIHTNFATSTGHTRTVFLGKISGVPWPAVGFELLSFFDYVSTPTGGGSAMSTYAIGYSTGSMAPAASIESGSNMTATCTGSSTTWANHITTGDFLVLSGFGALQKVPIVEVVSNTKLIATSGTTVATSNSLSTYEIYFDFKKDFPAAMAMLGTALYISDGASTAMVKYNGTGTNRVTASAAGQAVVPRYMTVHQGYMFGAFFGTASGSSLRWSEIGNAESWPVNNNITIDRGSNGYIHGLFGVGNELLIFKEYGMYKVIGEIFDSANPTFSVQPISVPSGFRFRQPYSVVMYRGVIVFKTDLGWYTYVPGTNIIAQRLSEKIRGDNSMIDIPRGHYPRPEVTNDHVFAAVWKDMLWTSPHNATSTAEGEVGREAWIADDKGAWWRLSDVGTATGSGLPRNLYIGHINASADAAPKVGLLGAGGVGASRNVTLVHIDSTASNIELTNNTAIQAEWVSKEFSIGYGHFNKLVMYLKKQTAGSVTAAYQIDQAAEVVESVDMTVGRGNVIRKTISINQVGSTIQVAFRNNVASQVFDIYGFEVDYSTSDENRSP